MAKPVLLNHVNQLLLCFFLPGDGLELHECKYKKPHSIFSANWRREENAKIKAKYVRL